MRVGVAIRCGARFDLVWPSLASVLSQEPSAEAIALVISKETPPAAVPWLTALTASKAAALIRADGTTPGAAANSGIRRMATDVAVVLDAGDELEPGAIAAILRGFRTQTDAAFLLGACRVVRNGSTSVIDAPEIDSATISSALESIHPSTPIQIEALNQINGFDEHLPALEVLDAILRMLEQGSRGDTTDQILVKRRADPGSALVAAWRADRWVPAFEALVKRHAHVFGRDPADQLAKREQRLAAFGIDYGQAVHRRVVLVSELEQLKARKSTLLEQLSTGHADRPALGDLARVTPVSRNWGFDRGRPIDRYFIERFLQAHAGDVCGRVLEIQDGSYTRQFGGSRVLIGDVLDVDPANGSATVIADLRSCPNIANDTYDCIILTQTLHLIDDIRLAIRECHRILKPGGVLLATLPVVSRLALEYGNDRDFWRITPAAARLLFEPSFGAGNLMARAHGNVLVNAAFEFGLACDEVPADAFERDDPFHALVVTVRAQKLTATRSSGVSAGRSSRRQSDVGVVLLYHRIADVHSDIHGLCVSPAAFAAQMKELVRHYSPMPLAEFAVGIARGSLPDRAVAVTFDDAYIDVFTDAAPVLASTNVPAAVFVPTEGLDADRPHLFWWDILEWALLGVGAPIAPLEVHFGDGDHTFGMDTRALRLEAHRTLRSALLRMSGEEARRVVGTIIEWRGGLSEELPRRMAAAEIRAISHQRVITIGAHSVHHLALPFQPPAVQRQEIAASRDHVRRLIGSDVSSFAYPYGEWSLETEAFVRDAGFKAAVICGDAPVELACNPFALPRVAVKSITLEAFTALLERMFLTAGDRDL